MSDDTLLMDDLTVPGGTYTYGEGAERVRGVCRCCGEACYGAHARLLNGIHIVLRDADPAKTQKEHAVALAGMLLSLETRGLRSDLWLEFLRRQVDRSNPIVHRKVLALAEELIQAKHPALMTAARQLEELLK